MWHSYRISLADLLGEHPAGPATIHREGVTHEVVVEAVSNDYPIDWNASALEQRVQPLRPINYGYQFTADLHRLMREVAIEANQPFIDAAAVQLSARPMPPITLNRNPL